MILTIEVDQLPKNFTGKSVLINNEIRIEQWFKNGKLHRLEGPAYIDYRDGKIRDKFFFIDDQKWSEEHFNLLAPMKLAVKNNTPDVDSCELGGVYFTKNGEYHREGGPAVFNSGFHWYKEGKQHRLDGPASIWLDGREDYYLNGEKLSKEEFENRKQQTDLLKLVDKLVKGSLKSEFFTLNGKLYNLSEVDDV